MSPDQNKDSGLLEITLQERLYEDDNWLNSSQQDSHVFICFIWGEVELQIPKLVFL